jgi:hypothetical protein
MDKLEINQGSFIQQTQYFITVEIDLSVVPARLGISTFSLVPSDNRNTRSTCPTSVFTGNGQTLMSRPVIFVHFKGFNISQKPKSSPLSYFAQKTSLNLASN